MKSKHRVIDPSNPLFDSNEFAIMCQGKKKYDSMWDARYAISCSKTNKHLSYYQCPYCKHYHLTSREN